MVKDNEEFLRILLDLEREYKKNMAGGKNEKK